ncbi:hypothetical protein Palpr_2957 [Paludibacter propionicigenes WB4]|uniref:DUF3307 domain-containing protein n=1 Tax=Paludibacter propionicigenes (strain DSM 17365 / JCM 13257 / WB4) TaxID=694427 RepID=E4T0M2_PALPW|nr:DUF3307 domain-containing protein [Paludibacter propionicigenes]ADQ81086.1 hypothetical protein Palpr_2957 [Paludibacter propionicigenes WB4]
MDKSWLIFTSEEGNFLIRLLLAHFLADFAFQTRKMVEHKRWFSLQMLLHIAIVFALTFIFTFSWKIAIIVSVLHWLLDALKKQFENSSWNKALLFSIDQLLHLLVLLFVWLIRFNLLDKIQQAIVLPFTNYRISLILLSYVVVFWPVGYLIGFLLKKFNHPGQSDKAGQMIGQFERVIILTLVLLQQYEAIGFLITGKSIIRFSSTNQDAKSEYVLLGTMLSYALAIAMGVVVRIMLDFPVK